MELQRIFKGPKYTIGKLYLNGKYFCDTCEDTVRDLNKEEKVYGQTAIPAGTYKVIVNRSPKFKRDLPRLLDVPYFEGVLIHRGNTAADSAGCILLGENKRKGMVLNSTPYEIKLVQLLKADKEEITITIK